jgi:hypothetical protein
LSVVFQKNRNGWFPISKELFIIINYIFSYFFINCREMFFFQTRKPIL